MFGETLIDVAYGLPASQENHELIAEWKDALSTLDILTAGTSLIEFFPILARVPIWLPGMSILRRLAHYRSIMASVRDGPWAKVQSAIVSPA